MSRSKFRAGARVVFVKSGSNHGQMATVKHVRPDGLVIVNFDRDPAGTIWVVEPLDVRHVAILPPRAR